MMRYQVAFEGRAGRRAGQFDTDLLQVGLEEVVNELLARRAQDATVSGTLEKGRIEISLTVEAPGFEEALHAGRAQIAQPSKPPASMRRGRSSGRVSGRLGWGTSRPSSSRA